MANLRLTLSCNEYDRTRFLVDGTIKTDGIDLEILALPSEERELFDGDPWPYNIKDNRLVLETMTRYAEMVGVTERKLEIGNLFTESVLDSESRG